MEGRVPKGVMFVLASVSDAAQEASFNDWYNGQHLPEVTRPGIFVNATRYVNSGAKGTPEDPRFLAVYETEREDVAQAWKENASHRSEWGAMHPALKVGLAAVYKSIGSTAKPPKGKRTSGVLVALTDCADAKKEAEFNKWYDEMHVPDVLKTGLYWSAQRFIHTDPKPGQPKYLALYETEGDGPGTLKALAGKLPKDRGSPLSAVRQVLAFNLTYSQSQAKAKVKVGRA